MNKKVNIAIFASGGGSNAEKIIDHFEHSEAINVQLVVTNSPDAGVLNRAKEHGVLSYVHTQSDAQDGSILSYLKETGIDFIVLAGYLKKVGDDLIAAYPNKIVNIHPALLPKYGGKGMYGMNVHRAVVAANESESGPTIHFVNEHYDEGAIIEQHRCKIDASDSAEQVQQKVLKLEHQYFAPCIERIIQENEI